MFLWSPFLVVLCTKILLCLPLAFTSWFRLCCLTQSTFRKALNFFVFFEFLYSWGFYFDLIAKLDIGVFILVEFYLNESYNLSKNSWNPHYVQEKNCNIKDSFFNCIAMDNFEDRFLLMMGCMLFHIIDHFQFSCLIKFVYKLSIPTSWIL